MDKFKERLLKTILAVPLFILWAFPASLNYELKSFEFGGGGDSMTSSNYALEGILGESTASQSSTNYSAKSGLLWVQAANVPKAPTLVNSSNWYNKLHITLDASNNPTDALFAIAITSDNWVTTQYVQSDNTIGGTLGIEDWQTYTNWGSGSGEDIIGLTPGLTYIVKVKAVHGDFTESGWGPTSQATTSNATIDFDLDIAPTDQETAPPYEISFGSLNPSTVTTATNKIWVDFSTNAQSGGYVYIYDASSGLRSANINYTISSATVDLSGALEGYGARIDTTSNLTSISPYNGASDNVGVINTTIREILHSGGSPVTSGRASILLKVKSSNVTPSANDYSDTITMIAAGTF